MTLWFEYTSWKFLLGQSYKAISRESDDNKFIYFYQMDGVHNWIYAIFLFINYQNKHLKEVNLSDKSQRQHCEQFYFIKSLLI